MSFYADLHIHSKYSRATSLECDLEHLALWAARKGIALVGTGDFTHPAWFAEIKDKLVAAEPGLFRLRDDINREVFKTADTVPSVPVRFMLTVEISTIYKRGDYTRKVHHVIVCPDLESAGRFRESLDRIGNISSDGRPILGLDSRDLLEITLETGGDNYLIPAHIWTPWFSVLGSKSGFNSIEECYGDLSSHIFALETGLSSDPPMNWRLSGLDRYTLVSNSDAHSPAKLGREACVFECDPDYYSIRKAMETGHGYQGTVEFFPEEGKYHMDGHRKCRACLEPGETRSRDGVCPVCGKPVTVGVMHRVEALADRADGARPENPDPFRSFIPLDEIISETLQVGPKSKKVMRAYESIVARLGPELDILEQVPIEDIKTGGSTLIAEAVSRMREGRVIKQAGYDGEYGVIRLFQPEELECQSKGGLLFELPEAQKEPRKKQKEKKAAKPASKGEAEKRKTEKAQPETGVASGTASEPGTGVLAGLDPDQAEAARIMEGPLLILAGPGTGKTRTLTHRIAALVSDKGADPDSCLALTFSRRAAFEMKERLEVLLPETCSQVPVMTFHALGLSILREHADKLDIPRRFAVMGEQERVELLAAAGGWSESKARKLVSRIARQKRTGEAPAPDSEFSSAYELYEKERSSRGLVDFEDLVGLAAWLLESDPGVCADYRERFQWVSVDEYQDVDELQYRLVRALCPSDGNICAIGDPDQAVYGFRGSDVRFFLRFQEDFPGARVVRLSRNYRSSRNILDAGLQVISESELCLERSLEPLLEDPSRVAIHEGATERAEAEFVVQSLERMLGGHSFFSIDSGRAEEDEGKDYTFSDFAVLYRTDAQAAPLVEALDRSGIPFQKRSHERLMDRPGVQKLTELLRQEERGRPVSELIGEAAEKAKELTESFSSGEPEAKEEDFSAELNKAVELLSLLADKWDRDLAGFLAEISLGAEVDTWDPRAERVSLLTLHAAKGLEFRVVFITGCEDGLLPLRWKKEDDSNIEEERRLFYVGMTRSKERLFLSRAVKRKIGSAYRKLGPSPFLKQIEERLLERIESKPLPKKEKPAAEQLDLF
ncbi:MAG: UvrD-helicase domain-containing protein [bacterium]